MRKKVVERPRIRSGWGRLLVGAVVACVGFTYAHSRPASICATSVRHASDRAHFWKFFGGPASTMQPSFVHLT